MLDESQNQNAESEIVTQPVQQPVQAEISEPIILKTPEEEKKPIEPPREIKPMEEISAPVEDVEQPRTSPSPPPSPSRGEGERLPLFGWFYCYFKPNRAITRV